MDLSYDAKMYQEIINQTIMNPINTTRFYIYSKFPNCSKSWIPTGNCAFFVYLH